MFMVAGLYRSLSTSLNEVWLSWKLYSPSFRILTLKYTPFPLVAG